MSTAFPFSAVVGLESAKSALLLVLIEPRLKGVLIASGPGRGKSTLARSLKSVIPLETSFVELPAAVTEDRLLGGVDFTATLRSAARQLARGLIAEANGGILYVDGLNLLESRTAHLIAAALDSGILRVEREGLSTTLPAQFTLIGAYDPADGEPEPALRDRVGLLVSESAVADIDERFRIIAGADRFLSDPGAFHSEHAIELEEIRHRVDQARARLIDVYIGRDQIGQLCRVSLELGVSGNRMDIFAVRAARASAALAGSMTVEEADLQTAIDFVLAPRAASPTREDVGASAQPSSEVAESAPQARVDSHNPKDEAPDKAVDEAVVDPTDSPAPILPVGDHAHAGQKRAARRYGSGKRGAEQDHSHGRYVRSADRPGPGGRVAIDATLRAAAPRQSLRRLRQPDRDVGIKISPDDLRFKRLQRKPGILFVFAVDASGSMALGRLAQAKGALVRLLQTAYVHRDSVALISFRGDSAEVLLPPTRSIAVARRLVDAMPAGGGTPVAAGLISALDLARTARRRTAQKVVLLILTDGRANVGIRSRNNRKDISDELRQLGAALSSEGVVSVVLDTAPSFVGGEARELAQILRAQYVYLPRPDAEKIQQAVDSVGKTLRADV